MHVCILDDPDLPVAPGDDYELTCDPRPFLGGHDWTVAPLVKETAVRQVTELSRRGFDVFLNLCDGAWDDDRPGIEVVQTLERLGQAFTGATSAFYEPSREAMKRVCNALGIATPRYVMANDEADVQRAADTLRFPLIVKHPSSYSSIDLTPESRVRTGAALRQRARFMMDRYGATLIEEYIDGREFTVLVAEDPEHATSPVTFTPIEFTFPEGEGFKHYDLKWVDYEGMGHHAVADPALAGWLRRISADFFLALNGSGYGRCDIRMGRDGELYMLEINPNCGIFYPASDPGSADLCLLHDARGHAGFTDLILRAAVARHRRNRPAWEVRADRAGGYGLFATRPVRRGEVVVRYEETPHVLVTRAHVEREWDAARREWFRRYAWPLTDEIWVVWDEDPERWKPVNHCCDPSTWIDGLDLVARRDLAAGEQVTVDYATFTNELMPPFECHCGTADCRGTITGEDWSMPFVERYGPHLSEYVRRRRG
jgi:D-ala D-ala ligase C-terminus/SET domain